LRIYLTYISFLLFVFVPCGKVLGRLFAARRLLVSDFVCPKVDPCRITCLSVFGFTMSDDLGSMGEVRKKTGP